MARRRRRKQRGAIGANQAIMIAIGALALWWIFWKRQQLPASGGAYAEVDLSQVYL